MVVGRHNTLKVQRRVDFGLYLDGGKSGEILLPTRYAPANCGPGDSVEVFVYHDSDDRLIATTETPRARVGEFALLKVIAVEKVGAFLDWGLSKDLFLPFAEQKGRLRVGQEVIVFLYLDKSGRISASMRLQRHKGDAVNAFHTGQGVDLLIAGKTDLGFSAVVAKRYLGLLYANELFEPLRYGQQVRGYVRKIRKDGKIDLSLAKAGSGSSDQVAEKIVSLLREKGGFLPINDKTPAEKVYRLFGVSKNKYKLALARLYKRRRITIGPDGVRSV